MQVNKPIEIDKDCQFMHDLTNNAQMARYNLIIVTGQLKLYSNVLSFTIFATLI